MHAAGIEFDHAFFVGNSAEADAGVVGIVLRSLDHFERGVERVAAAFQEGESVVEIVEAVVGADDDWALVRSGLRVVCLRGRLRWARVPTPVATAPRTDVFTKSRREKVMSSLSVRKREAYHAAEGLFTTEALRHGEKPFWDFYFILWFSLCLRGEALFLPVDFD